MIVSLKLLCHFNVIDDKIYAIASIASLNITKHELFTIQKIHLDDEMTIYIKS